MDVDAQTKAEKGVHEWAKEGERETGKNRQKQGEGREIASFFLMGGHEMKSWRPTLDFL